MSIDMDRLYDALVDAVDNGEIDEREAAEEWRWAQEEVFKEITDKYWGN